MHYMLSLTILFTLISVSVLILLYLAVGQDKLTLIFFIGWSSLMSTMAFFGAFDDTSALPPRILLIIIPTVIYVIYFFNRLKKKEIKIHYLTAIHSLRLPVELGLFYFYVLGQIPVAMTFEGWNYDIFMGITSILILGYLGLAKKSIPPRLLYIWNILGIVLLTIIVSTAMISAPTPLQLINFDQPNVAIKSLPFLLLPIIIVPIVLLSHLLALNKLKVSSTSK